MKSLHSERALKASYFSVLEGLVQVSPRLPSDDEEPTTAYVMDGMAVVQMVKTTGARTFGEMAGRYFDTITAPLRSNNCNRVDVVFDRYDKADSIKESERRRRGSASGFEIKIAGPNTPVPKNGMHILPLQPTRYTFSIFWARAGPR